PFGDAESVADRINTSADFGYNEATHQFVLPPAGSQPDLTIYASASSSDTDVKFGPSTLITQTPLLSIVSQDTGRDITINEALGGRFNFPVAISDNSRFSIFAGADFKRYVLR